MGIFARLFGKGGRGSTSAAARHPTVRYKTLQVMRDKGGMFYYWIHSAPSRAEAVAYLRDREVKDEGVSVAVETPEGNFGKDLIMIFDEKTQETIELGERKPLPKLRKSITRCARCGYTVLPAGRLQLPAGLPLGSVTQIVHTEEMRQKGVGFHCRRCKTLWCPFCVSLRGDQAPCGICDQAMDLFTE